MGDSLSSLPQPTAGDELHTSWATTLIAELTSMLTRLGLLEAATVVDLCDSAGQDVADAGAVGTSTYASRCDHKHEGVHSLVAGTNITLDPASGLGDVTVTAAAGGAMQSVRATYAGDDAASHVIELGFRPKIMYLYRSGATHLYFFVTGNYSVSDQYADGGVEATTETGVDVGVLSLGLTNDVNYSGENYVIYAYG